MDFEENEIEILKFFLLGFLHKLFSEIFKNQQDSNQYNLSMESYAMDSLIVQSILKGIIETGEYTLEGIAYYTQIPFDVIYDAASGIHNHFSVTPWAKIANLYLQVKPEIAQLLINRLLELKNQNNSLFSLLLNKC
jgi:hypothetical protein